MPPRRAAATKSRNATTAIAESEKKKKSAENTKSQSRKRTRAKRGDDVDEEGAEDKEKKEKDEDDDDEMTEENTPSPAAKKTPRAKKKTKRSDMRSPSPAASDRASSPSPTALAKSAAAAASSSAIAHLAHARSTNVTLKCDSDCLSLVFSFLTTKEFGQVVHVDKRWCNVSKMKTSWPRYNFFSVTSLFHHEPDQHPVEHVAEHNHRSVIVRTSVHDEVDVSPLIKHGVAKNLTALKLLIGRRGGSCHTQDNHLTSSNFPHLSQLEFEETSWRITEVPLTIALQEAYGPSPWSMGLHPIPVMLGAININMETGPVTVSDHLTSDASVTIPAIAAAASRTTKVKPQSPRFTVSTAIEKEKSNPTLSLAGQLRVLKLMRYDWERKEGERPLLLTIGSIASFTRLEVLTLHDSCIPDECLVQLHQLRCFRMENTNFRLALGAVRCVRYLSVMHLLRSFFVEPGKTSVTDIITILCDSQWSDTLAIVEADSKVVRWRKAHDWHDVTRGPPVVPYDDPIPSDELTRVKMNLTRCANLDEFELGSALSALGRVNIYELSAAPILPFTSFHRVLAMPLKRLTALLNPPGDYSFILPEPPAPELFPEELEDVPGEARATMEKIEHLDITLNRASISLEGLAECKQLRSLKLTLVRKEVWQNRDFSTWLTALTLLEELTLEFNHETPLKLDDATWTAMGELKSLRRLDVKMTVGRPFPFELLAQTLATLPQFYRLDLRLECEKHLFALPPGFFAAVTSSSTWRYFHFAVKSIYKGMAESKTNDLKKLTTEQLLSDTLQRFRVYRHCRPTGIYNAVSTAPVTTQYRIGVKETKSATAKYQPYWQDVAEEDEGY